MMKNISLFKNYYLHDVQKEIFGRNIPDKKKNMVNY